MPFTLGFCDRSRTGKNPEEKTLSIEKSLTPALSPITGQLWTLYVITVLCPIDQVWSFSDPFPPLFVHVVIKYPLFSHSMAPNTYVHIEIFAFPW